MILLLFLAEFWVLLTKGKRDFYHGEGRAKRRGERNEEQASHGSIEG